MWRKGYSIRGECFCIWKCACLWQNQALFMYHFMWPQPRIWDLFNPLRCTCNLRSVFRVFECADVSVDCQMQLLVNVCVFVSTEPFLIPSVYIWSSSHTVRWPLTPRALSWRSLASVSTGARWSRRTTRVKTRVVYFNLPLCTAGWENVKAKRKRVSFEKVELCNLP